MRRIVTSLSIAFACFLSVQIQGKADDPPAEAMRYVEIYPAATAKLADLERNLKDLGFQPAAASEFAEGTKGPIRGRLPQRQIAKTADLADVARLAMGKTLAADPEPIKEYLAFLRFRIDADQQERYAQYSKMMKRLSEAGFKRTERDPPALEDDWRYSDLLDGTLQAKGASALLEDESVRSALLMPAGYKLPEKPLVELRLDNYGGRQREVADRLRARLQKLGFEEAVGYDHRKQTRLIGRLPIERVVSLHKDAYDIELPFAENRNPRTALGRVMVPVQIYFEGRTTTDQVAKALEPLGFELGTGGSEKPGKGGSVVGRLLTRRLEAAGKIDGVTRVIPDFGKAVELAIVLRRAEVLREPADAPAPALAPPPEIPANQPELNKVSVELRQALPKLLADAPTKPIPVEIVLRFTPGVNDSKWEEAIGDARLPFEPDGRVGPLVVGSLPSDQIGLLAKLPEISTIRFPQAAREPVMPPFDAKKPTETGLEFIALARPAETCKTLDEFLRKREKHRIIVIDGDFRGWKEFIGKGLPEKTRLFDMTAERSPQLYPDPVAGEAGEPGIGTRLALAVASQTPIEELILVRIDPAAPYMVQAVANAVSGSPFTTDALRRRSNEIDRERLRLERVRKELRVERRIVMDNFRSDEDARKARAEYRKRQEQFDKDENALNGLQRRLVEYFNGLKELFGAQTVLLGLHWTNGHPSLPGERGGFRYLDPATLRSAVWIQAIQPMPSQTWTGMFRDSRSDDAMDFAAVEAGRRERPDLNFLAWQPLPWRNDYAGPKVVDQQLPADSTFEVTLTWREIHSPAWKQDGASDAYRPGIAPLQIILLRQRDPAGQTLPSDLFEVVGRTHGWPDRVENTARYAIYQITLRYQVPKDGGRYAVRIEGRQPDSTLPAGANSVPNPERWELHPKLTAEVIDPTHRHRGRVLWQNYWTAE